MTDTQEGTVLGDGRRWTRGDWLHTPTAGETLAAANLFIDGVDARADDDTDRLETVCGSDNPSVAVLARTALGLFAESLRAAGPDMLARMRAETVNVAAEYGSNAVAVGRLETLALAEALVLGEDDRAMELAIGSEIPMRGHWVSAIVMQKRLLNGPQQRQAIALFRELINRFNPEGGQT